MKHETYDARYLPVYHHHHHQPWLGLRELRLLFTNVGQR